MEYSDDDDDLQKLLMFQKNREQVKDTIAKSKYKNFIFWSNITKEERFENQQISMNDSKIKMKEAKVTRARRLRNAKVKYLNIKKMEEQ